MPSLWLQVKPEDNRLFKQIFGNRELRDYFDGLLGFDIVKFDDKVIHSGDGSMEDKVREDYGPEAVKLIKRLIRII